VTDAVVVAAARSPLGRAVVGSLREIRADDLAAAVVQAVLDRVPALDPSTIDDLLLGCAYPQDEQGENMARRVAVQLGLDSVGATTVNRLCASSLQAIRMALHAIRAGEGSVFVSAGAESMSRLGLRTSAAHNPIFAGAGRGSDGAAATREPWLNPRRLRQLPDVYISAGQTAENVARTLGISRQQQDEFGVRSHLLTEQAIQDGFYRQEIVPIRSANGSIVDSDDCPRPGTTYEAIRFAEPALGPHGTVTEANTSPANDGAAALIILSASRAQELGVAPLARILATGVSGISPEITGLGAVAASQRALHLAGLKIDDIDLWEIHEASAAQVIATYRILDIEVERVNVHGGSIALGQAFGMTGARLVTTLLNGLRTTGARIGLATLGVGGGQGMALILERLS
jgi:acetyl-CoA C-acetyltransferase